jgi:sugar lactone lactonase YvrE
MPDVITERAWSSPIWYSPTLQYTVLAGSGVVDNSPPASTLGPTGVQATSAKLGGSTTANYLSGMAKDAAGNLYIADAGNAVIRRVDPNGYISTFAGNGTAGAGTNSEATCTGAQAPPICIRAAGSPINGPSGVAVDSAGNVYFSEFNNGDIRMVDTQGDIWHYASLPGQPTGIAIDGSGDLYVAMYALCTVLEIPKGCTTPACQKTVAGMSGQCGWNGDGPATSSKLSNPNGVWVDGSSNLYVDDAYNYRIRMVANNAISTIVGNGTQGYSPDGTAALSAKLHSYYGVTVDGLGNVFISDTFNNVIRMVDTKGTNTLHTVAGSTSSTKPFTSLTGPAASLTLDNPGYMWMDGSGNVYVSDLNGSVYELGY